MKKLFFLLFFTLFSCEDSKKITPYLKAKKDFKFNLSLDGFISDINFLFVIDTSGSMSGFKDTLSKNVRLFLDPILKDYPYYNYNFAITSMTPYKEFNFTDKKPLYLNFPAIKECHADPLTFSRSSNMGSYLSYNHNHFDKVSYQQLLCSISSSIQSADGFDGGAESFFQSIRYITEKADSQFRAKFFGPKKILVLFFISDAAEGVDYAQMQANKISNAHNLIANKNFQHLKNIMGAGENIRSYAVIVSEEKKDNCGEDGGNIYPLHAYSFIKLTKGLRISICDTAWGQQLTDVADDFLEILPTRALYLKEIPKEGTIEVFFNNIKVDEDINTGWSLDKEKQVINLGSQFDFSYYKSNSNKEDEIIVRYHPMNLNILQKSE